MYNIKGENNIKMELPELEMGGMGWIALILDRDWWRVF
jgi:hypothetical protein